VAEIIRVQLEVHVEDGSIRGSLVDAGRKEPFEGWLGLIAVIDGLQASVPGPDVAPDGPSPLAGPRSRPCPSPDPGTEP
jgi:hypothetical protein